MDRRQFLGLGAFTIAGCLPFPAFAEGNRRPVHFGWNPVRDTTKARFLSFQRLAPKEVISSGKGQKILLYKYLEKALGKPIVPVKQGTGDCVGQAFAVGVDTLAATQIFGHGRRERFIGRSSPEVIYGGSRYEIGYLKHGNEDFLDEEGSHCEFAAQFLKEYGSIFRGRYGDIDLTRYDSKVSDELGKTGIPDELEEIAKKHPVRSYALVRSYEDVRDAIANGYPVIIGSTAGFNPECPNCNPGGRDSMGFLNPCGEWHHAMVALGVDDESNRPGVLLLNSWGVDWVKGGKRLGQPLGSFWVDAHVINNMCLWEDSYAISNFQNIVRNELPDYNLF